MCACPKSINREIPPASLTENLKVATPIGRIVPIEIKPTTPICHKSPSCAKLQSAHHVQILYSKST